MKIQAGNDAGDPILYVTDRADTPAFYVRGDKKIGIGTDAPLEKLHVASGSVLVTGAGEGYAFEAGAAANTLDDY